MTKRRKPQQPEYTAPLPARLPVRLIVPLAAMLLTALAAVQVQRVWLRLPVQRLINLDDKAVDAAFLSARSALAGEPREGFILVLISDKFTRALHEPDKRADIVADARALTAQLPHTQVGRLQVVALTMLQLEQDNVPPEEWWPRLRVYVEGLNNARFDHFLPDVIAAESAVYERLGLGPGTARQLAHEGIAYAHGPFLQYLTAELRRLVDVQPDAAVADTCQRLLRRLLRDWTVKPGPIELRLLAMELLAEELDRGPAADASVAEQLRAWRGAYRTQAGQRPPPLGLFSTARGPALAWREHDQLALAVQLCLWSGGALVGVAVVALLLMRWWLLSRTARTSTKALGMGVAIGIVLVVVGYVWSLLAWNDVTDDLRRLATTNELGWPRLPCVAAGLGAGLTALAALWSVRASARGWHAGVIAAATWISLAVCVLVNATIVGVLTEHYEARVAAILGTGVSAEFVPDAERALAGLRSWEP